MIRSYRAYATLPVLAAAITAFSIAPAVAQNEQGGTHPPLPPEVDVPATVVVGPNAASTVLISPSAPPAQVVTPAPGSTTASVIVAPGVAPPVVVAQGVTAAAVVPPAPPGSATVIVDPNGPAPAIVTSPTVAATQMMDWQSAHWERNGFTRSYIPGQYVPRAQGGSKWVPGRWEQPADGDPYTWISGHWS